MSKPVWVLVHWSESIQFKDNELIPFAEFEHKARFAASLVTEGYDKTKIKVLFDDGHAYGCRLDLSPREDCGFESHVRSLICWYERSLSTEDAESYTVRSYKANYEFLKSIEWRE